MFFSSGCCTLRLPEIAGKLLETAGIAGNHQKIASNRLKKGPSRWAKIVMHTIPPKIDAVNMSIGFLVLLPWDDPRFLQGINWVCPRDNPGFSSYFTNWKPNVSL